MGNLSILFDIAVLLIVVICVFWGTKKGFIHEVCKLLSSVISLFLAKAFYPQTKIFLEKILVKDIISSFVSTNLDLPSGTAEISEYSINSLNLPDFIKEAFKESEYLKKILQNNPAATLKETVSNFVADYAVTMLAYVITFVLAALIIYFLLAIFNVFSILPVFKYFNTVLGGVTGFITALIIIWVVLAAFNVFLATPELSEIFDSLDKSIIARMLYKFNPIVSLITSANGGF